MWRKFMLCVIAAMAEEVGFLDGLMTIKKEEALYAGRRICTAEIDGKPFILAISGIGKVNSAAALQYVFDKYDIDTVINIGTAGGFSGAFKKNSVMIPSAAYQHDYDLGPVGGEGYKRGGIPGLADEKFIFDKELTDTLKGICIRLGYEAGGGVLVSGDQFISDEKKVDELKEAFGASACDMEGGALLQATALNGFKRIAAVKSISDNADDNAADDFSDMTSSKIKIRDIIREYLKG
jgi:adenosylhomocysteine nucleosidase